LVFLDPENAKEIQIPVAGEKPAFRNISARLPDVKLTTAKARERESLV